MHNFKIIFFISILLLSFNFLNAQSKGCKKKRLIEKGEKHINTNPDKALVIFKKAIRKDPYCLIPYIHIADMLKETEPLKALRHYDLALFHGADSPIISNNRDRIIYSLAISNQKKRNFNEAIKLFKQVESNPLLKEEAREKRYECLLALSDKFNKTRKYDNALIHLNTILSEDYTNQKALERKLSILEIKATQKLQAGDFKESLNISRQAVDCYKILNIPISCENYTRRANIHFNLLEKKSTITELKSQLVVLADILDYPNICTDIQKIQDKANVKKQEIWGAIAKKHHDNGEFQAAHNYMLNIFPFNEKIEMPDDRRKINLYLALYAEIKFSLAEHLHTEKKDEPTLRKVITLCDEIILDSRFDNIHSKTQDLRKNSYLDLIRKLREKEDTYELLDYINRLQVEYPDDDDIQNLRASLIIDYGIELNRKCKYEMAGFYYAEAEKSNTIYSGIATFYLAKLAETAFDLDTASILMKMAIQKLPKKSPLLVHAKKDFYRYQSILHNEDEVIDYLYEYYCSDEYPSMIEQIKKDNSYYNLQDNPRFQRWVNGKRRLKISNLCVSISYNPDKGSTTDAGFWDGPDLVFEIFGHIYRAAHKNGMKLNKDYCWGEWSKVYDFDITRKNNLPIIIYEYDPFPFTDGNLDTLHEFEINLCKIGRNDENGSGISLSYKVEDSSEEPYIMTYVYGKSGLQIGFELSYCLAKRLIKQLPTYFFVHLAEELLVHNPGEINEATMTAATKTALKKIKNELPSDIKELITKGQIAHCFIKAIKDLNDSGWVKKYYTEDGDRIVYP